MEDESSIFPSVSIITVVRNDAAHLQATMDSVWGQTYPNKEYIIIDGASTDGTVQLIEKHQAKLAKWVSEPDAGLYDAMNKGLQCATGDFVWFINSGDLIYEPCSLEKAFSGYVGEDILYGQAALINETGQLLGLRRHKRLPRTLTWRHLRLGMVVSHQALLVRRTLAEPFELSYRIAADIDWTIKALKKATKVKNTGLILCKFLVGGTSARRKRKSWLERFHILNHHFGLPLNLLSHAQIVLEVLGKRLRPGNKPTKA